MKKSGIRLVLTVALSLSAIVVGSSAKAQSATGTVKVPHHRLHGRTRAQASITISNIGGFSQKLSSSAAVPSRSLASFDRFQSIAGGLFGSAASNRSVDLQATFSFQ